MVVPVAGAGVVDELALFCPNPANKPPEGAGAAAGAAGAAAAGCAPPKLNDGVDDPAVGVDEPKSEAEGCAVFEVLLEDPKRDVAGCAGVALEPKRPPVGAAGVVEDVPKPPKAGLGAVEPAAALVLVPKLNEGGADESAGQPCYESCEGRDALVFCWPKPPNPAGRSAIEQCTGMVTHTWRVKGAIRCSCERVHQA